MSHFGEQLTVIATAIIGLATLAVLVSRNANTTGVISTAGEAFTRSIGAAVSPVTGQGIGTIPYSPMGGAYR
jgi:hypothetical protein